MYLAESIFLENKLMLLYRQNKFSVMHKRSYGIEYYEPIIEAYLQLDKQLAGWSNETRGHFNVGHALARNYLLDMIEEHFQTFKNSQEIEKYMSSKPNYIELLKQSYGGKYLDDRYLYMKNNKSKFILKNRLIGCKNRMKKAVLYIPFFKTMLEKKKYSIRIQNEK